VTDNIPILHIISNLKYISPFLQSNAVLAMESARSLYKNDIDFAALALQSRDFAKQYVKQRLL
jgi:hypothetical protein